MLNRRDFAFSAVAALAPWPALAASGNSVSAALSEAMAQNHGYPCTGMVAGLCDGGGRQIVTRGIAGNGHALDGDTVFDIGSITKLFTALALADMVARGQMAMEDPLAKYLPAAAHVPKFQGRAITLLDLVTYSPGLPGWPADMPALSEKPFPDYSVDRLYHALSQTALAAPPGTKYVYSNFGFGLLGLALARHAGMDFESLIVSRICDPLGMESTRIAPTRQMRERIAPGHFQKLARVKSWNMPPAFAAAGAFRSTANDLLKFLSAAMGASPLAPAFAEMMKVRRPAGKPDTQVAAGWFLTSAHDDRLVWKDGGVLGYSSFIGYSALRQNGVVVLANGNSGVLDLGKHLINPDFPLEG
ncbi:MAG TPA: serine hydrolase domain-containing protein [Rhizomicrobium sp.]|nr:serine hydrolase domain-containing protein [Rhizomicrobium sp.]